MKKALLLIASISIALTALAQAPTVQWAKSMGSSLDTNVYLSNEGGVAIALDKNGNSYSTGVFIDTVDFDPGLGVFNLISAGNWDVYVTKLDSSGNFIWAKSFGGVHYDGVQSISVDSKGNVYTIGDFSGTTDFDPSSKTFFLTGYKDSFGQEYSNNFLSKLDSNGNFLFANRIGDNNGFSSIGISSLYIDISDNLFLVGAFHGSQDIDPSSKTFALNSYYYGYHDGFLSKFDSKGNFIFAKQFTGATSVYSGCSVNSITLDSLDNLYLTGNYTGEVDFNPGSEVFNLTTLYQLENAFILKLDVEGNFIWVKELEGKWQNTDVNPHALTIDKQGNVYTTGSFRGAIDMDPGDSVYWLVTKTAAFMEDPGKHGVYLSKLDNNGNFVWAKSFKGDPTYLMDARTGTSHGGESILIDKKGNVYSTGLFEGTFDFDPSESVFLLTADSNKDPSNKNYFYGDAFISKLDSDGRFIWAVGLNNGASSLFGSAIVLDKSDNLYATGSYRGSIGSGKNELASKGNSDIYILKLNNSDIALAINEENNIKTLMSVFPNPCNGFFEINIENIPEKGIISIYNSFGVQVYSQEITNGQTKINMGTQSSGLFIIKLISNNRLVSMQKIINQ